MTAFVRTQLLDRLKDVGAALARSAAILEFSHFWFDGTHVAAYDGGLGIRMTCKTDFKLGLPGRQLMDMLGTTKQENVFLEPGKGGVVLQMGRSKYTLAALEAKRSPWPFPTELPEDAGKLTLSERFFEGLKQLQFIRPQRGTQVVHHGITIIPNGNLTALYATDSKTLATFVVAQRTSDALKRFLLPWTLVEQIVKLARPGAELLIADYLCVHLDKGQICCNMLELPGAPDLKQTADNAVAELRRPVALPAGLATTLDRAVILAGTSEPALTLTVKGEALMVVGDYPAGRLDDKLPLKGKTEAMSGSFNAALIARGLKTADSLSIGKQVLALYGGDTFAYIVAGVG